MQPPIDLSGPTATCQQPPAVAGTKTLAQRLAGLCQAVRRIVGAPDYEVYLARHRQVHPGVPPLSEKEFFRFAVDRRYSKAGPRCC